MALPQFQYVTTVASYSPNQERGPTVVTDGTDLYYMDTSFAEAPTDLYKYTVSTDSFSKLVDRSEFYISGSVRDIRPPRLAVFRSNIYAMSAVDTTSTGFNDEWELGDAAAKILKITPDGVVTTVVESFARSYNQQTNKLWIDGLAAAIYSTESTIVGTVSEAADHPSASPAELMSMYSTDGSTWVEVSEPSDNEYTSTLAARRLINGSDFRTLGIYNIFGIKSSSNYAALQFDESSKSWSELATGGSPPFTLHEVGPDYLWNRTDFSEYTTDWVTFVPGAGSSFSYSIVSLNMPHSSVWGPTSASNFHRVDDPTSSFTTEVWAELPSSTFYDDSNAPNAISTIIRLNNGAVYLVTKAGSDHTPSFPNWSIWKSDTDLAGTPGGWGGGPPRPDEIRYLGMDADNETLYVTSLQQPPGGGDNFWTLHRVNLDTLKASTGSELFGVGVFGDIDTFIEGIYPVVKPGTDNVAYLRGRDGSDIKVQKNDYNSSSAWSDIGQSTWATSAFAMALMPDQFNASDMIAGFGTGSVFRTTVDGGASGWTSQSDAPQELRTGARNPTEPKQLLVAACGAGSVFFSHNYGASFAGASGSALGLVDAIEWDL